MNDTHSSSSLDRLLQLGRHSFVSRSLMFGMLMGGASAVADTKPNVLFISIDDWRNDLAALGVDHVYTPEVDRFATKSVLFSQHYVQAPVCGASRASLISGMRPRNNPELANSAIRDLNESWGDRVLPRVFRQHGYRTYALGKITHYPGGMTGKDWDNPPEELPNAWDRSWVPVGPWENPEAVMHGYANGVPRDRGNSPAWEAYDGDDKSYPDGWVAEDAVAKLSKLAASDEPWFFAVGFFKPHLPLAAPKAYWDLYDRDAIPAPLDQQQQPAPSSWIRSGELMGNYGHDGLDPYKSGEENEAYAQLLRHGYAAATSYVDAQVGKVLQKVRELDLMDDLIIVIWSDHGFALGERNTWGKHTLYEAAVRSPLLIRYPGMERAGTITNAVVETVDLFPTLTDLAGLPGPEGVDGLSLRAVLENPCGPSLKHAYSYWYGWQEAVRDDRWRLIVQGSVSEDDVKGVELFDFKDSVEGVRVDPADHPEVVARLKQALALH